MPDYIVVPEHRRARVIHEKARARKRGEILWIRSYIGDLIDDDEIARETVVTRFLDLALVHLAARYSWILQDDPRRLAGVLGMRTQDVRWSLDRLIEIGRIVRIRSAEKLDDGSVQMTLQAYADAERMPSRPRADSEPMPSGPRPDREPAPAELLNDAASGPLAASTRLAQSRAEQRREEKATSNASASRGETPALPDDSSTIVGRIIGLACRGDQASAAIIRSEARGLPDHVLARALESLIGRRPRPTNPAGYIVNALRSIAAENGYVRERAQINREPEL